MLSGNCGDISMQMETEFSNICHAPESWEWKWRECELNYNKSLQINIGLIYFENEIIENNCIISGATLLNFINGVLTQVISLIFFKNLKREIKFIVSTVLILTFQIAQTYKAPKSA